MYLLFIFLLICQPLLLPSISSLLLPKYKTEKTVIIAIGSGVTLLVSLTLVYLMNLWRQRKTRRHASDTREGMLTMPKVIISPFDYLCRRFSLDEIKRATSNFQENLIIGRGGFGYVFKGLIDEGNTTVAIKRLNPESNQGYREFLSEIETVSQLRCVHIVSLIGYCYDDNEMILVYEYIANGTLRDQLYGTDKAPLPWKQRLQICVGAARGLHYLHTGAKHPIIHRDIKTTNILLDEKWVAKICDFGLSKQILDNTAASYVVEGTRGFSNAVDLEESGVSTTVKGTLGYLDPEYARRQRLTETSDVYSFGAVLWEVLCARKPIDMKLADAQKNLCFWARTCLERGKIGEIIDPCLKGTIALESFKIYVEVAEGCVRRWGIHRPTMNDVLEKLESALELQENASAPIRSKKSARKQKTVSGNSSQMHLLNLLTGLTLSLSFSLCLSLTSYRSNS